MKPQGLVIDSFAQMQEAAQSIAKYSAQGALINATLSDTQLLGEHGLVIAGGDVSLLKNYEWLIMDKDMKFYSFKGANKKKVMCFGFRFLWTLLNNI